VNSPLKRIALFSVLYVSAAAVAAFAQPAPIRLHVDATEAARRIYHVELTIPALPGPMDLFYPKWIPGEHAPVGPIADLAGLKISAGGRTLEWKRDNVEMFAFHVNVPPGANSVNVKLDFLATSDAASISSGGSATSELAVLSWNPLILYPRGRAGDDIPIAAELLLPEKWMFGTALPVAKASGNLISFQPVSLTTLIDSPVVAGAHFRRIELTPGASPAHYLEIAADSEESLTVPADLIEKYKRLIKETQAVFGGTHYGEYHFLLALSDQIAHFGLEHHQSSVNQARENYLTDPVSFMVGATLVPHEFVHSWNGKYRRPDGLATRDYEQPMKGDLLWVYEGLTEYYGWVLAVRSGLRTPEQNREFLALDAAMLDNRSGRIWRSLADTAVAAQILYEARSDWESSRRGIDFYDEGMLIWLEADMIIRRLTDGRKSLDDFCRSFYGGASSTPQVKPYTFTDLTTALNAIAPYEWKAFLETRINRTGTIRGPLGGIEQSGYRVIYVDKPSEAERAVERIRQNISMAYSVGLILSADGTIVDVLAEKPAARAGIGPGMRIIAVNGRKFSVDLLRDGIRTAMDSGSLVLQVANGKSETTYNLNYREGEKYPILERTSQAPLLDEVFKPAL
jgi:predicted metalloprotease with PDZ domain